MRSVKLITAAIAVALAVTACTGTTGGGGSPDPVLTGPAKPGGTVTIANTLGQTWNCHFNPFSPSDANQIVGYTYEPLIYVNPLNGDETPMLAEGYTWNEDKTSIVFDIRQGVTWSDGTAFTAADVAYTFTLLKDNPALDILGIWPQSGLTAVTATGDQVTMEFVANAQVQFINFAGQVGIVPQHIWDSPEVSDPVTWENTDPVGTGPFTVNTCTTNNIEYTANPDYWQPGKPAIQTVEYPAYLDNNGANLSLATGKSQWGAQFIPNIEQAYLSKSPDNHTWNPPTMNLAIYPNLDPSRETSKLAVRQAIAAALDRDMIAKIGEGGQLPAANQTGVVLPTFEKFFDADALKQSGYDKPDTDHAMDLLADAGYSPDHPLKLEILSLTGWTDFDACLAVIKQQLKPIGIDLTVTNLEQQALISRVFTGDFDMAFLNSRPKGPSPYYELRTALDSENTAPIGEYANGNWGRYRNPDLDQLFDDYAAAPDIDAQVEIMHKISGYIVDDVPFIPVVAYGSWYQYNTQDIAGWPTEKDPYAMPGPYNVPDNEQILLHIYSKSAQE